MLVSFYATLAVASSCIHADPRHWTHGDNPPASVTAETNDHEGAEWLCKSIHEHWLAAVGVSNATTTISPFPPLLDGIVDQAARVSELPMTEARPPGSPSPLAQSHRHLRLILRI